jgi:periplasmic protein TonB
MQHKILCRLFKLCFFGGIILNMSACHGNDNSEKKTNDTASSTANAVKTVKKKGKTSVSFSAPKTGKIMKDAHGVYNQVEVNPEFPGGHEALSTYINTNLTYSQPAIDDGINGTIHISFVVDEHGKVLDPQVIDGKILSAGMNEETLKLFNNMPLWKPGLVHGKKVKTRLELPVTFQLEDA